VKALYRRGLARVQLAEHPGHGSDAALARGDFEEALRLEPGNADVRNHLRRLRSAARAEMMELNKSQRESFKGIFDSGKALYEDAPVNDPAPIVHSDAGADEHLGLLSVQNLCFYYDRHEQVLQDLSLELRAGWCVGLFGNNAAGKTTLARLLSEKLSPQWGSILHHGVDASRRPESSSSTVASSALAATGVAVAAVLAAALIDERRMRKLVQELSAWQWAALAACFIAVMLVCKLALDLRAARARGRHAILHVSSESNDKEEIPDTRTIERVIGEKLPRGLTTQQRRAKVIAMLQAGGFQMYNQATGEPVGTPADYVRDGLQYGSLSGGQRHLIYVLRGFAQNPRVLVCDEVLGGLDAWRQPRVLHMLQRLKRESDTAILYIGTELHQLRLVCDSIGFLHKGKVCELGPAEEVLDFPKHPATKDYIEQYRGLPGGRVIGGKLAENYTGIEGDKHIAGPWLPW